MQLQLISIIGGLLQHSHAIAGSALLIQPVILPAPSNATKQKWLSPIRPTPDSKRKMRVGNCNVAGLPATQTLESSEICRQIRRTPARRGAYYFHLAGSGL